MVAVVLGVALLFAAPPGRTPSPKPAGSDLLARAGEARHKHDLVTAERLYEQALREDPSNGPAALGLAETLTDMGQSQAAEGLLLKLVASLPERPEPRCALALAQIDNGKTAEALEQARKALALDPNSREGHLALGSALAASGSLSEAIPELQKASEGNPPDARALHRLALVYASLGDAKAEAIFERVLKLESDDMGVRLNFATYLWQVRDFNRGNAQMERLIAAAPANTKLRVRYADSLVEQTRYVEAAKQLEEVRRLGMRDYDTTCSLAAALGASGQLDEAVRLLREAAANDPGKLLAHHTLGRLLLVQQKPTEAVQELELCARLQPESAGIALELGHAYEGAGDLGKAEAAYRQALKLDPKIVKANYALGTLLSRTGQREQAAAQLAIYQAALQKEQDAALHAGSQHAELNVAWDALAHGQPEQALERFDQHPDNADALRGSARALVQLGRDAEAIRRYERAVALAPEDLSLRYELDREYERVKKK